MPKSLIGEEVTLIVNFTTYTDAGFHNVDLVTETFTVGAGTELQNISVNTTFYSSGFPQTMSGNISVDVTASGMQVWFSGTQQGGTISYILSKVTDESASVVGNAAETGQSGFQNGINQTQAPSTSTANDGTVTAKIFTLGYQPGVNLSQTISFDLTDPPRLVSNTGAGVNEGATVWLSNSMLEFSDTDAGANGPVYTITQATSRGTFFFDQNGNTQADSAEVLEAGDTFTQADVNSGKLAYLHDGSETGTTDRVYFTVSDGADATGSQNFRFNITAVNDAPTGTGLPSDVTVLEDVASNLDLASLILADVDSSGDLILILTASEGTMTASSSSGVTVSGSGSGTLTLTGTAGDLNSWLNTVSDIKYTGALNDSGNNAATLTVSASDGAANATLGTVNIDITAVNDAPTGTGLPSDVTVTEDTASNLDLSSLTLADVDSSGWLVLTLTASEGTMAASSSGGVTVSGSGSGTLTLTGTAANLNTWLNTASNIQYTGALNDNGNNAATLMASVSDGTDTTPLGTVNIDITAVNDAPTGTGLPTDVMVLEDVASNLDLASLILADVDSSGNLILTLTASEGTMAAATGYGVTVGGSGSGTLTLTGTAVDLNIWLNTVSDIKYTGALNDSGDNAATLTVSVSDGAANATLGTVNIDITAVNDAPTGTGLPSDVTVTEDVASDLDLSSLTLADVDSSGNLILMLTASEGTMAASSSGGVNVVGSGTGTLTLTGLAGDLNTWLNTVSNIQYTGTLNDSGDNAATLTVSANDGAANATLGTVNIDITGVDDAATANADALALNDASALSGDVFADNGSGADSDIDSPLAVTAVEGAPGNVGSQITLASGALLTLNANGTFDYDPNGKFEYLPAGQTAHDSFTYAVNGVTATVSLTINGIDNKDRLDGTTGDDSLSGGVMSDTLIGNAGADLLDGGDGVDTASYSGSNYAVNVSLLTGYAAGGHALGDVLTSIENLAGSSHNDVFSGDGGANRLMGNTGDDLLRGRGGADTLDGGDGVDTASYSDSDGGVVVSLAAGSATGGHATGDVLSHIENLDGSNFADSLAGDSNANLLQGNGGDDTLKGGAGADILNGGAGIDIASYFGSNYAVNVSLLTDYAAGGHAVGDSYTSIEGFIGSDHGDALGGNDGANVLSGGGGDDILRGRGGADMLTGGAGSDTLDGGAGGDTASYAVSDYAVNVSLLTGYAAGGHALGDELIAIENLTGSDHNDVLRGNAGANILNGGQGSDSLRGDGGADTFVFDEAMGGDMDVVLDFENGVDHFEIQAPSLSGAGFSDLIVENVGGDAIVRLQAGAPGAEVTLIAFTVLGAAGQIDTGDFTFV